MHFNIWFYNSNRLHGVLHLKCLIWNFNTTNAVWHLIIQMTSFLANDQRVWATNSDNYCQYNFSTRMHNLISLRFCSCILHIILRMMKAIVCAAKGYTIRLNRIKKCSWKHTIAHITTRRPFIINFSLVRLLRNHCTEFDETWQKASITCRLPFFRAYRNTKMVALVSK